MVSSIVWTYNSCIICDCFHHIRYMQPVLKLPGTISWLGSNHSGTFTEELCTVLKLYRTITQSFTKQKTMILFPRFHLMEIEDQSWCPNWLRESSHSSLAQMWKTESSKNGSPASQACDLIFENLDDVANFTFVDACAGAGGPTPLMEERLNRKLRSQGKAAAPFILTDLYPDLNAWKPIVKKSQNISYIETPIDATKARRLAAPSRKECRTFNLCFHHFDDPAAKAVLRSAVQEADAFMCVLASLRLMSVVGSSLSHQLTGTSSYGPAFSK